MATRELVVTGYRPAQEKEVTRFLRVLDVLGAEDGVAVAFSHRLTLTLRPDVTYTQELYARQVAAVRKAYISLGCINVEVR